MENEYAVCLIMLLKGIVYNHQKEVWAKLLRYEPDIKRYFRTLGLELEVYPSEGYAFLKQKEPDSETNELPKLVEKRPLNFLTSLLCILLRKYLLEQDAQGGSIRSIITGQEIINRVKVFLPATNDEAKQQEKIITTINRVIDIGFLRKLDEQENAYEVHRIIKGFVNADLIDGSLRKLREYAASKNGTE